VRARAHGTAAVPRLSVFVSNKHYYAQAVNDDKGVTVAASSDTKVSGDDAKMPKQAKAEAVGRDIAAQLKEKKVAKVVFDRGERRYAGAIKALADAARGAGLIF